MFDNINFKRFDKHSTMSGFTYASEPQAKDYENNPQVISMENPGYNLHVSVYNYTAECVMLGGNVRSSPYRISSLLQNNVRMRNDQRNFVVIKLHSSETQILNGNKPKAVQVRKTEIRIPGQMLNQGSVFIEELDCYLTTESKLDATRELIARDITDRHDSEVINLPSSLIVQDPVVIYNQYKALVDYCIHRQDLINVRTGFDFRHTLTIPDVVKNMRIAILDHYFVPFAYNNLVFDPTLSPDEFVIENLHLAARGEYHGSYSDLIRVGAAILDGDLQDTLTGKFYGMAIFASEARHSAYLHERKAIERFRDEQLFLAERSGDPMLKEEIIALRRDLDLANVSIQERDEENIRLRDSKKRLTDMVREREKTITDITEHRESRMSTDVVLQGLDNDRTKLTIDATKLEIDRSEQEHRAATVVLSHRAIMFKYIADILKSGWGIATACTGGLLAFFAVMKKYNVRLSMG